MKLVGEGLNRISQIIDNLRSYVSTGTIKYVSYDLKSNIETSLNLLKKKIQSNNVIVETKIENLPEIKCKAGQINQVITNLIINSCEMMPDGGKIYIEAKEQNGVIELLFKDTGPGVPKELRDKIFDPFYSTKDKGDNAGLGLYISLEIIESHNGELHLLNSEKGAEFLIKLPVI